MTVAADHKKSVVRRKHRTRQSRWRTTDLKMALLWMSGFAVCDHSIANTAALSSAMCTARGDVVPVVRIASVYVGGVSAAAT